MLSSPSSPDSCLSRYLPSPLYSCCMFYFQIAFSILSVCQVYLVHLSFQNVFPSQTSKITLLLIDHCYAILLVTSVHWCDLFFLAALHCTIYLPQNSLLIYLKRIMCDQKVTSMSKRCNIWFFASDMPTVTQRSVIFCSFQSCHVSTSQHPSDNPVPKQFQVSSLWGVNLGYI